jgi:hypothetical protein
VTHVVSALFVDPKGPYWGRSDVDAWGESRDARNYRGPLPVVAHPPCGRWCRLARLVESRYPSLRVGHDGGCFASALRSVVSYGGVLEHPAWSLAWSAHGIIAPNRGGWCRTHTVTLAPCWVCEINQATYGHAATKATWLLYVGRDAPARLNWSRTKGSKVVGHCTRRCDGTVWRRNADRMHGGTHLTPPAFAETLIDLARNCGGVQ